MNKSVTIGKSLKAARVASGMSQTQLGDKVNMHKQDISGIENGRRKNLNIETIERMADALGLNFEIKLSKNI